MHNASALWLSLGLFLGLLEILTGTMYLLVLGLAACLVAALAWALPDVGFAGQLGAFCVAALAMCAAVWRGRGRAAIAPAGALDDPGFRPGETVELVRETLQLDQGRARWRDSFWDVRLTRPAAPGVTTARIERVAGTLLIVEPVAPEPAQPAVEPPAAETSTS